MEFPCKDCEKMSSCASDILSIKEDWRDDEKMIGDVIQGDDRDANEFFIDVITTLTKDCKLIKEYFPYYEPGYVADPVFGLNIYWPGPDDCKITEKEWKARQMKIIDMFEEQFDHEYTG